MIEPTVVAENSSVLYFYNADEIVIETVLDNNAPDYYIVKGGYVDGKPADITIDAGTETDYSANAVYTKLAAAAGQLSKLALTDGYVVDVTVIGDTAVEVGTDLYAVKVAGLAASQLNEGPTLLTVSPIDFDVETVTFVDVEGWDEAIGGNIWLVYTAADYDVVTVYG